jgi:hypothetical protein
MGGYEQRESEGKEDGNPLDGFEVCSWKMGKTTYQEDGSVCTYILRGS